MCVVLQSLQTSLVLRSSSPIATSFYLLACIPLSFPPFHPNICWFLLKYSSVSLHLLQAISLLLSGGGKKVEEGALVVVLVVVVVEAVEAEAEVFFVVAFFFCFLVVPLVAAESAFGKKYY